MPDSNRGFYQPHSEINFPGPNLPNLIWRFPMLPLYCRVAYNAFGFIQNGDVGVSFFDGDSEVR